MEILNAIILGIIQGVTEFLPISSSGHLIIFRNFLGQDFHNYDLAFDSVLQLATTFAILVYFYKDILNLFSNKKTILKIILATIPAVAIGILLENQMETIFRDMDLIIGTLILGTIIMFLAEMFYKKNTQQQKMVADTDSVTTNSDISQISTMKAIAIGFFQSLALLPGMSRSGMTISGGIFCKLNRELAVRFSFLLAIPILLGSGLKKLLELFQLNLIDSIGAPVLAGSVVSFIVGILAIHFLIRYLRKHTMMIFVWYRIALIIFLILFF